MRKSNFLANLKVKTFYFDIIFLLWACVLIVATAITTTNVKTEKTRYIEQQLAASELMEKAMNAIKERKQELGIPLEEIDINQTGLIGPNVLSFDTIQTTMGKIESKRTITNPNMGALIIKMLHEAGVKENEQINIIFSGSFPAFNIAILAASQVMNLQTCIMCSIGASQYGATNENFTFFDMTEYLYQQNIFTNRVDYLSWGGGNDCGIEFSDTIKEPIMERITASGVTFIQEDDFINNVNLRMDYYQTKNPKAKVLINSGGSLAAVGDGTGVFKGGYGVIKPNYLLIDKSNKSKTIGIMDRFLSIGVPVINLENISYIVKKYNMEYDPSPLPKVGEGNVYYETRHDIILPIIMLTITSVFLVTYGIIKRKKGFIHG